MDYFGLCMDALNLAGQGVMHIFFASRLTGKEQKPGTCIRQNRH